MHNEVKKYLRNGSLKSELYDSITSSQELVMRTKADNLRATLPEVRSQLEGSVFSMMGTILQNKEYMPKGHPQPPLPHGMRSMSASFF